MPVQRQLLRFFLLVFALSIPFWLIGALSQLGLAPGLPISGLAVVTPAAAAMILIARQDGRRGLAVLLERCVDYRRIGSALWYVPIVLLWPAVMVLSYVVMRETGSPVPAPRFSAWAPLVLFLAALVAALGEELGWSGYALDRLQARWTALRSGLVLGLIWAGWHTVLFLEAERSATFIGWQSLTQVATRIVLVWLYNNTGKSVFATAVCHAMMNTTWQLFPIEGSYYDPKITGAITLVAAAIVVAFFGPRTLTRGSNRE